MKTIAIMDLSDLVGRWIRFLKHEAYVINPDIELATRLYNRDITDLDLFCEFSDTEYGDDQYDYLFENIDHYLVDPINDLLGKPMLLRDLHTVRHQDSGDAILGVFVDVYPGAMVTDAICHREVANGWNSEEGVRVPTGEGC